MQCDDNKRKCMMTPSSKSNKMNNVSPVNIMQPILHSLPKEEYDLSNLLERERLGYVPQYIDETTEITPVIRGMLVDWIMSICSELGFYRDTFHTAINIMDRYLSKVFAESPIHVLESTYSKGGTAGNRSRFSFSSSQIYRIESPKVFMRRRFISRDAQSSLNVQPPPALHKKLVRMKRRFFVYFPSFFIVHFPSF